MLLSATGEYNTGASHSHVSLGNPHKEHQIKRICNSEPFLKPLMSLKKKRQNEPQQTPFSIVQSKNFLNELATALSTAFKFTKHSSSVEVTQLLMISVALTQRMTLYTKLNKIQESCGKKKPVELKHLNNASKKLQMPNTDNSIHILPQKKKHECFESDPLSVKAVWENITRPSAKVILDPNTANPALKLSVDGRSVRTKTHKEFQFSRSFPEHQRNNKHHYNSWMCVQAQEGYTTGRHYWEVDVKKKRDWRIGVVKESASRTGFINLNTAAGYWTLRLQLGCLMALTVPVTKLNQAPPCKLGVLLDLEESQVSFYDAIKKKHLYTFKDKFGKSEKMFPVFGTVETDKPLKII